MKNKCSLLLCFLLVLNSCKYGSSNGVKKPYVKMMNYLEEEYSSNVKGQDLYRLDVSKALRKKSEKIIDKVNDIRSFERRYYTFETENNVQTRLNDMNERVLEGIKICEDGSLELQKMIYGIGKNSFEERKANGFIKGSREVINSEILTLFSLQYIKRVYETCSGLTFHYMNEFSVEEYDDRAEVLEIRKTLLSKFFGLTGMLKIIGKDSETVSKNLMDLRESNSLDEEQINLIQDLAKSMKKATGELQKYTDSVFKEGVPDELQDIYKDALEKSEKLFADKSLLFDPANPDAPIVHALVILSNLTWGSVQSVLGLGIILTHAVAITPISWILGLVFSNPYVMLRGPSIKIAKNKMQLYADVCGFPAIPSKMSLGIWEMDFCAGYSFASYHEGGHAKQSALLGPLYLPAAILSYTLNLGHGGFIESWADAWSAHSH